MLQGLFITGTDTGIGKTEVGAQIVAGLQRHGIRVTARKPVESGCDMVGGELQPADALRYREALDNRVTLERICPFRFEAAVAPPLAARMAGSRLTIDDLIAACGNTQDQLTIVEGAGGFYSPLAEQALNADLASALAYPVLLVAADQLGCINHVLLTLEAIQRRGLETLAIILNAHAPATTVTGNISMLRALQPHQVIPLGHSEALDVATLFSLAGHPLESLHHRVG